MNRIDTIQNLREPGNEALKREQEFLGLRSSSLTSLVRGYAWYNTSEAQKELLKYQGLAVAIFEDQVVASAPTTQEAGKTAERIGYTPSSLVVVYVHNSRDSIDTL